MEVGWILIRAELELSGASRHSGQTVSCRRVRGVCHLGGPRAGVSSSQPPSPMETGEVLRKYLVNTVIQYSLSHALLGAEKTDSPNLSCCWAVYVLTSEFISLADAQSSQSRT